MLSVLSGGPTVNLVCENSMMINPSQTQAQYYVPTPAAAHHPPKGPFRLPRKDSFSSIHFRSSSMPESVYVQVRQAQMNQLQHLAQVQPVQFYPLKTMAATKQPPPFNVGSGLKRSITNAGEFGSKRPQSSYFNPAFSPGQNWGSNTNLNASSFLAARSRVNIAAAAAAAGLSACTKGPSITRAMSFHHQKASLHQGIRKDIRQPLHVDCSIEYDLGMQPKIPKDSAPLLIIHPAFDQKSRSSQKSDSNRFHPYPGTQTHFSKQVHLNLLETPCNLGMKPGNNHLGQSAHQPNGRVARHASFLAASSEARQQQCLSHAKSSSNLNHAARSGVEKLSRAQPASKPKEFFLSMPDISQDDEDDEELARYHALQVMRSQQQQVASRKPFEPAVAAKVKRPVRRGTSMVCHLQPAAQRQPRSRMNLDPRLEAVHRLSTHSQDSKPFEMVSSNYSFEFKEIDDDSYDAGFESFTSKPSRPFNVHPTRLLSQTGATFCDSGLGTPSSLIGEDLTKSPSTASSLSTNLNRWKSNMSGLVHGFLCCATGPSLSQSSSLFSSRPMTSSALATPARCHFENSNPRSQVTDLSRKQHKNDLVFWQNQPLDAGSGSSSTTSGISSIRNSPPPSESSARDWKSMVQHGNRQLVASSASSSSVATPMEEPSTTSIRSPSSASSLSPLEHCQKMAFNSPPSRLRIQPFYPQGYFLSAGTAIHI